MADLPGPLEISSEDKNDISNQKRFYYNFQWKIELHLKEDHLVMITFGMFTSVVFYSEQCFVMYFCMYATHSVKLRLSILVLTIFNEGAYLTFKSIFHKALNLI